MKCVLLLALLSLVSLLPACSRNEPPAPSGPAVPVAGLPPVSGEALFKQYCSSCHPDGGNVSDPERALHSTALAKYSITTPDDIVRIMRHPLSRMIRFDPATLPDREARAIAEYILATFK